MLFVIPAKAGIQGIIAEVCGYTLDPRFHGDDMSTCHFEFFHCHFTF
jgi:hypothetical protein